MKLLNGLRSVATLARLHGRTTTTRLLLLRPGSISTNHRSISSSCAVYYARPSPLLFYPRWVNGKHPHDPAAGVEEESESDIDESDETRLDDENRSSESSESAPPSSSSSSSSSSGDDPS